MSKFTVMAGWDDVPHLTQQQKDREYANIPAYQRDARSKGIPQLGAGAIYPVPESELLCEPFTLPDHFLRAYGFDVGWNKTAGMHGALDRDTDILYLYAEYYRGLAEPASHAAAMRGRGDWIPGVIDPASRGRSQKDGEQLMQDYMDLGLNLTAAFNGVESGLFEVLMRMQTGRLKVFKTCQAWLTEFRLYRRDDNGKVVKTMDHLMDATRYLVVSGLDVACLRPANQWAMARGHAVRHQADYDPYRRS